MAHLAGVISRKFDGFFPVTDSRSSVASLGPSELDLKSRLRKLRFAAVVQALPAPSERVPAKELKIFKDKHREELRRLKA